MLNKKMGFTLVETLIVLAAIGIVAALVITLIVGNSQKQQYVSALQKANNVFANVVNRSQIVNSTMDNWNYSLESGTFAQYYITPFLSVAQVCGSENEECFAESYRDQKNGVSAIEGNFYNVILTDGVSIGIQSGDEGGCSDENPSVCATFIVDTNGKMGPNQWGRDMYKFEIYSGLNAVVPAGTFEKYDENTKKWLTNSDSAINGNCTSSGEYCAAKIINDGWKMNY